MIRADSRRPGRLVWAAAVVGLVCAVVDTLITAQYQPLLSEASIAVHGWPFVQGAALCSAAMGALIVSRFPRHPVGWLLSGIGLSTSLSLLAESYSIWQVDEGGPGTTWDGDAAGWISALFGGQLSIPLLAFLCLLVPHGHLLSRHWRWAMTAAGLGLVLFVVGLLTVPARVYAGRGDATGSNTLPDILLSTSILLTSGALLAGVVSMALRLRRAQGDLRQQLRWIAASAATVVAGLVILIVGQALNGGHQTWLTSLPLFVAFFCLPVGIAVAVLRYRLYDIDVIISRGLVLALGTTFVACGYIALVVGVGGLFHGWTKSFWPSLTATVLVALAFQPLRRRLERLADRLVYGRWAAPYDALAEFSHRLGRRAAPEDLLPTVAQAAAQAVRAESVVVHAGAGTSGARTAQWPPDQVSPARARASVDVPVEDRAGSLAVIAVTMPPGRDLRPHERRLLEDIAEQTAVVLRNDVLEGELAANLVTLKQRNDEIEASRRRLMEAADAERHRLEAAISREVLPSLSRVQALLAEVPETGYSTVTAEALVAHATDALESLRQLSHGIFPTLLSRSGLGAALSARFARAGRTGTLDFDATLDGHRFPARVEAAAYFLCERFAEGAPDTVHVRVTGSHGELLIDVSGAAPGSGADRAVLDRVEAVGGRLESRPAGSTDGGVTHLRVRLPLPADPSTGPDAAAVASGAHRPEVAVSHA